MNSKTCPDRETLRQLLLGKVCSPRVEQLEVHLDQCDACSVAAGTISASDELTAAIRSPDLVYGDEDILDEAIKRAKRLGCQAETVETEETIATDSPLQPDSAPDTSPDRSSGEEEIDFLAPAQEPDEMGRLGDYRVLEVLGVGGMGVVFRAEDPKLERQVAIKAMKPAVATSRSAKDRFIREARATAAIEHDNIVHIYQVGEEAGVPFIAMQLLRGESLQKLLEREERLDQREVLRIGREIATGLAAAHRQGLIHRDIKPDNIWLEAETGRVKIVDFGLVRSVRGDDALTQTGMVLGTPKYMAPEQAQGESVDHRCDLFSLGSVLYHLATGQAPFSGGSLTATLMAVAHQDPEPIETLCPKLDNDVAELIRQLLSKDRDQRPGSADKIAETIDQIERKLDDEQAARPQFPKTTEFAAVPTPARARTPIFLGVSALVVTLVILLGLWASGILFRVETPRGTLVVKVGGDNFSAAVQGQTVTIQNVATGETFRIQLDEPETARSNLAPGEYQFVLVTGSGLRTNTNRFTISSGKDEVVEVWWESVRVADSDRAGGDWQGRPADAPPLAIAPFDAAKATQHQQAWAAYMGVPIEQEITVGQDQEGHDVNIELVLIPPGEFRMGSSEGEQAKFLEEAKATGYKLPVRQIPSEGPQHRVRITKPFELSRHEITRGQFQEFVEDTGYITEAERDGGRLGRGGFGNVNGEWIQGPQFVWNGDFGFPQTDDCPVVNVSWNDAVAFCRWLSEQQSDFEFTLPTEAQWEYACRAGTTTFWHSGDKTASLQECGWFSWNSDGRIHPVGKLRPNAFGLYDMHGSAAEWCADLFGAEYYATSPTDDPPGASAYTGPVHRGGRWDTWAFACRSAYRDHDPADSRNYGLGFRVAAARKRLSPPLGRRTPDNRPADAPPPAIAPFTPEQAMQHQRAWADYLGVPVEQDIDLGNGVKLTMVLIPPGEFLMGSSEEEQARFLEEAKAADDQWALNNIPREGPQHLVRLSKPFWLSHHELTRGQFRRFVESTQYRTEAEQDGIGGFGRVDGEWVLKPQFLWDADLGVPQTDAFPVMNVTWNDAVAYCVWLSQQQTGWTFALPTEAQWEYSCRAGTTTFWHCGDSEETLQEYGWFSANYGVMSHSVGELHPNGFGLYDMHANVWEWCADWYAADYYATSPTDDPTGRPTGSSRVIRGGGTIHSARHCRSARRHSGPPDHRYGLGFRLAATIDVSPLRAGSQAPKTGPQLPTKTPPKLAVAPFDTEQAKQHQQVWADYLGLPVEFENSVGMKMVLIPPGEFMMGSTEEQIAALLGGLKGLDDSTKQSVVDAIEIQGLQRFQHRVEIARPFYLAVCEVTRGQFRQFVEETRFTTDAERDGRGGTGIVDGHSREAPHFVWNGDLGFPQTDGSPVVNVSWNDATAFCFWLSDRDRAEYRLPTEAWWEYACRAGTTTAWCCGDSDAALQDYGWFGNHGGLRTHSVGQLKPNSWGLYDMHGNVWEWCQDLFDGSNPGGRNVRGGSFVDIAVLLRSAWRGSYGIQARNLKFGFRVAMVIDMADHRAERQVPKAVAKPTNQTPPPPAIAPFDAEKAKQRQQTKTVEPNR